MDNERDTIIALEKKYFDVQRAEVSPVISEEGIERHAHQYEEYMRSEGLLASAEEQKWREEQCALFLAEEKKDFDTMATRVTPQRDDNQTEESKSWEQERDEFFRDAAKRLEEVRQNPELWEEEQRHRLEWGIDPPADLDLEEIRKEAEKNKEKDMERFKLDSLQ